MGRPTSLVRLLAAAGATLAIAGCGRRDALDVPAPETELTSATGLATFGGGCFWCVEAIFQEVAGVASVTSGYSGGRLPNPTYEQVGAEDTGHAEAVQIRYDPARVSYETLLEVFFRTHDPTTPNRQGADVGPQYRSVVFAHDDAQLELAARAKARLDEAGIWDRPIVTEIVPFDAFYPAESYHQDYYAKHPSAGYCVVVIGPKLAKFRKVFKDLLKPSR